MIMKLFKTTLITLLICLISLTCASANRDGDPFRIFIDFLKQEMLYHKDAVYYPFPFEDITFNHKVPRIETNPERIKQLICDGISYNKHDSCADYSPLLEVPPHRIKIQTIDKDSYKTEAFVTVPDSSATLSLSSANICIPQKFDSLEVTLMRIEDNVAYLLIEDKRKLFDYSYTRPDFIDEEEEKEDENAWKQEYLSSPYEEKTDICTSQHINISAFANDGFQYFQGSRITGVAYNAEGKKLAFETLSEDFRHYLWYRNMDMPYTSMEGKYRDLQERFPSPQGDNRYHLLQVVRLEASGRIARLDVNVLSHSIHTQHLLTEGHFKPYDYYADEPSLEEMTYRISTIKNIRPDSMSSKLTVTPYIMYPRSRKLEITAFLPTSYNTRYGEATLRFTRMTFPYETDSITLEGDQIRKEDFHADYFRSDYYHPYQNIYGSAATLTEIPLPDRNDGTLTGEVKYRYPYFEAARYDLPHLPEGLRYENDTLFFNKKKAAAEDEYNTDISFLYSAGDYYLPPGSVTAYDKAGKKLYFEEEYGINAYKMIFKRPVKAIIYIWEKDEFRGKIPFSIKLSPPQNN